MELDTMVQLTGIHSGLDLADAPASLQTMAVRRRSNRKKVRKRLLSDLELAVKVKTVKKTATETKQKKSP